MKWKTEGGNIFSLLERQDIYIHMILLLISYLYILYIKTFKNFYLIYIHKNIYSENQKNDTILNIL